MFARKLSRLAGLVLVLTVAFGAGAGSASAAESTRDTKATTAAALTYDWN